MIRFAPTLPNAAQGDTARPGPNPSILARFTGPAARRPLLTTAVTTIALAVLLLRIPLCADVSWQLWIAQHVRQGARLYIDIVETNPPLWYWMAIPVDAAADATGIAPGPLLVFAVAAATLASLAATERLIRPIPPARRTALLVAAALAMLIVPAWMTGQKEQLLLIASLPYVALAAARREGREVSIGLALAIGAGAALGFALKHYFLLVPAALELWLVATRRRAWRPVRPETAAVAIVGVAYVAAILRVTPEFLTVSVPLVRLSYGGNDQISLLGMLSPVQAIWAASLLALAFHHRLIGRATPLTTALLVGTAGFGLAWAIQLKGWDYQGIAVSGGLVVALAALWAEARAKLTPLVPATIVLPILFGWFGDAHVEGYRRALAPLAAETRPGDTVGFVSTSNGIAFPFANEQKLRFPSRYYGYWMLGAVIDAERHGHDPRLAALGRAVAANTAVDFRCTPPSRILFTHWPDGAAFDILAFFERDPDFRDVMRHYRREHWRDGMDVFRQVSPLPPIPASSCRRGV